jgi:2-polyprenyl-3-methyl-5-hydroxy-6-metoxy-1,4-benzoquinol methylase
MTHNTNIVSNYGWDNVEPKGSQVYLSKPIVETLRNLKAKKILDLGCGNGALSHYLQSQGFCVVGCDADRGG